MYLMLCVLVALCSINVPESLLQQGVTCVSPQLLRTYHESCKSVGIEVPSFCWVLERWLQKACTKVAAWLYRDDHALLQFPAHQEVPEAPHPGIYTQACEHVLMQHSRLVSATT